MKRLKWEDIEFGPVLGTGTVGTVYQAHLQPNQTEVAIKVLLPALTKDPLVRSRFEREMEILERLEHPNVIRYYGGGEHDGSLYFAMEMVHGGSVKELLERFGSLSWQEVASAARQVCSALQHVHNQGIIHRDLKPGNLFITQHGTIKLGDFGIARDTLSADLTSEGYTVGTHAYMSPEQITGEDHITGQADLYSLGCVLFEMLTGRKPFQGTNFASLFEQHLRQPPPRLHDFVSDCPPTMNEIIYQLLAKDPDDRPFNARSVQGVMMQLLAKEASLQVGNSNIDGADVAAGSVVDPGLARLAKKLNPELSRQVSWPILALVGFLAVAIVCLAAFSVGK